MEEVTRAKQVNLENKALKEELEVWRREHARKLEERKSYFEPQVLVIDDEPPPETEEDESIRPKSAFKSSFDCDEAINVVESIQIEDTDKLRRHKDKERKHKSSRHRSKSKSKETENTTENKLHQPIIVSNNSTNPNQMAAALLRPIKPPVPSQLTSLRQLKTNLTPLPEIRLPK